MGERVHPGNAAVGGSLSDSSDQGGSDDEEETATFAEADTDESGALSQEELEALTIKQIKAIAEDKGYTITKSVKSEIITEFLAAQHAAQAVEGYRLTDDAELSETKTYYIKSGTAFEAVVETDVADIATYYEKLDFWPTEDSTLDANATYYTSAEVGEDYEFTAVGSPDVDNIGTYWEEVPAK